MKLPLLIILGIILIALVLWKTGILNFHNPKKPTPQASSSQSQKTLDGEFKLSPETLAAKIGDKFYIEISVNSNNHPVTGVDLILKYDPQYLEPQLAHAKAVQPGSLFNSYPPQGVDPKIGRISFSAIGQAIDSKSVNGILGKVAFKTLKAGTTKINIDFTPHSTIDSNITNREDAQDILGKVNSSEITITSK